MTSLALGWLLKSAEALPNDLPAINDTQSAECVLWEQRVAFQSRGAVVGIVTNEDLLDQIFRECCIGKSQ
ncbi:MAG: hypothetical protein WD425_11075 [Nitrospirales bacterium]